MNDHIWRSRIPPPGLPPALLDGELLAAADRHANRRAVVDALSGRALTYEQLAEGARRVAGGLTALGAGHGDVVALIAASGVDYATTLLGLLSTGAAVASANPALTAGELGRQFAMTRPKVVCADRWSLPAVREALTAAQSEAVLRSLDADTGVPALAGPPTGPADGREPSDDGLLFPSSGTTGLPRIAVHTHAGTTAWLHAFAHAPNLEFGPDDVIGTMVPFTHLYGTGILTHSLTFGASVVTINRPGADLASVLRLLEEHAVTIAPVNPTLLMALARHPDVARHDLSRLRLVMSSAAPCSPGLLDEVEHRLGCRAIDMLGSSEAWCYAPAADPPVRGSCGTLGPGVEAVVLDTESGARLGPDRPGELCIRAGQIMRGYLGDEAATAATIDGDGWLHTGDVCSLDATGNISMVDRLKELIKVGGYSVAPAEVERELLAHRAVADAAVVGRPHAELGEVPVAYVALSAPAGREELLAWLDGRLAAWKRVHDVIVVEQVPRSPIGKVLRRELRDRERAAAATAL